jgi:hypothetical protein
MNRKKHLKISLFIFLLFRQTRIVLLALCFERSFFLSQVPPSLPPLSADYASWLCRSPAAAAAAAGYFPLNPSNLLAARLAGK